MKSFSHLVFELFSIIAGLISPIISILIGVALQKIEDVVFLMNPQKDDNIYTARNQKTIRLFKLIGLLMIIYGAFRLMDKIFDSMRFLTSFVM